MNKYTRKDIIIIPTIERAKNCIGKEVYFSDSVSDCLYRANNDINCYTGILGAINEDSTYPFYVGGKYYQFIIPKKVKQKPEYVPFESADEFLNAYENSKYNVINVTTEKQLISCGGFWLKSKSKAIWVTQCINISNYGVTLGLNRKFRVWKELLDNYEFLDGTPCGKKKE